MERTGPMSATEGAVDRDLALANVGGDQELLAEIVELFVGESPRMMAAVDRAVASSDAAALRLAAHTLKGSASVFGAQHAVELSFELESMGDAGELTGAEEILALLRDEIGRVIPSLEALVEG